MGSKKTTQQRKKQIYVPEIKGGIEMKIKENLDINNPISYMSDKGEMRELGSTDAIENLLKLRPNLRNNKNVGVIEKYTGVLNIIDSVNELQKQGTLKLAMRNLENSPGLSFMKTERDDEDSWIEADAIRYAQPFEISEELFVFAGIHAKDALYDRKEAIPIPSDCTLCASNMFLSIEIPDAKHNFLLMRDRFNSDKTHTFLVYDNTESMKKAGGGIWPVIPMGSWEIGKPGFGVSEEFQGWSDEEHIEMMSSLAFLVMTINQTRYVTRTLAGTRQQRRNASRGFGKATDAWTKISWNIDKPVVAKEPYDAGFHKKALHFRRGHWRLAEEHHPMSKRRPQAMILRHRALWWTWIEGYWAGHPAFGTQKSYHQPKISKEKVYG